MNKKYSGAVFFDIDGTLVPIPDRFTEEERIASAGIRRPVPESAKEGIKELNRRGYLTAIATGRSEDYMYDLGVEIGCIISANGTVISVNGETVHTDPMRKADADALRKYFTERGIDCLLETPEGCFLNEGTSKDFVWAGKNFPPVTVLSGEVSVVKMISYFDDKILDELSRAFGDVTFLPHRYDSYMDINSAGFSKASGVKKVLELYGIDVADSYAFGDDLNDLEMLEAVGHGIAMTPHAEALDRVAEHITDTVDGDGIYEGLKFYGLV